jgi:hypothetical protein
MAQVGTTTGTTGEKRTSAKLLEIQGVLRPADSIHHRRNGHYSIHFNDLACSLLSQTEAFGLVDRYAQGCLPRAVVNFESAPSSKAKYFSTRHVRFAPQADIHQHSRYVR